MKTKANSPVAEPAIHQTPNHTPHPSDDSVEAAFAALPFHIAARRPAPCTDPKKEARLAHRLREVADGYRYVTSEERVPWTMLIALSHAVDLGVFARYVGATLAWHWIGPDRAADLLRIIEAEYKRLTASSGTDVGPLCTAAPNESCTSPNGRAPSARGQASMDFLLGRVFGLSCEHVRAGIECVTPRVEHPGQGTSEPPTRS